MIRRRPGGRPVPPKTLAQEPGTGSQPFGSPPALSDQIVPVLYTEDTTYAQSRLDHGKALFNRIAAAAAGVLTLTGVSCSSAVFAMSGGVALTGVSASSAITAPSGGIGLTGSGPSAASVQIGGAVGLTGTSASSASVGASGGISPAGVSVSAAIFGPSLSFSLTGASPASASFNAVASSGSPIGLTGASASSSAFDTSSSTGALGFTAAASSSGVFPPGAQFTINGVSASVGQFSALPLSSGSIFLTGAAPSSAQFDLQSTLTPPPVVVTQPGTLLPGKLPGDELGKGIGPYKRPGQVFGEQDPVSPFLTAKVGPPAPTFHVEQPVRQLDDDLALVLLLALEETVRKV